MKSAKDFAEVWGISSASAGKKLKRLNAVPESKLGSVLFYTDETFTKLTGVKVKSVDFSNLISSIEVASKFNIKDKSVRNKLRKHNVKIELSDGGIPYYIKDRALSCFQKRDRTKKKIINDVKNTSKRYRLSIFSKNGDKFVVKYVGLRKEDCLKRIMSVFNEGWDFCVRSYEVEI